MRTNTTALCVVLFIAAVTHQMADEEKVPKVTRVALVTGAAQGIGASIGLQLADDGLDIALNDSPSKGDELAAVARAIEQKGRRAIIVLGDVSAETDVKGIVDKTVTQLGGLDVVRSCLLFSAMDVARADNPPVARASVG